MNVFFLFVFLCATGLLLQAVGVALCLYCCRTQPPQQTTWLYKAGQVLFCLGMMTVLVGALLDSDPVFFVGEVVWSVCLWQLGCFKRSMPHAR